MNVLIGPNGAGKSNFVEFFRMLRSMADENLQTYVLQHGADGLFYLGPQHTRQITAHLAFGANEYRFVLVPSAAGGVVISKEELRYSGGDGSAPWSTITAGYGESTLKARQNERSSWGNYYGPPHYVFAALSSWVVYHFHDTSFLAPARREQSARDNLQLHPNAENIAAFLLMLRERHSGNYELIRDSIRLVAPFFDDFLLRPERRAGDERVRLEWVQKGMSKPFQPSQLSDGTLRFICLATALLQPRPPSTIVVDEPELGLHPYAISVLADLFTSASARTQVIVSTQSPGLVDRFSVDDIVIVGREAGRSVFKRPDADDLGAWLAEYSLGELWEKNVLEASPSHE